MTTSPDRANYEELLEANRRLIVRAEKAEIENVTLRRENERLVKKCNRLRSTMQRLHWIAVKAFAETGEVERSPWTGKHL
jgi:hypothetical protein